MPKASRQRTELHTSSVKLQKRQFAVHDKAVEHVNIGEALDAPGNDILHALSAPEIHVPSITKKEKQSLKREAFLQRLSAGMSPYSKSHARRLKRKAKEQIAGGLNDVKAAITELEHNIQPAIVDHEPEEETSTKPKSSPKSGKIGEGKGMPLSAGQRKRALKLELMRQPLILSDPTFASNPFQAIRTHAQNTLVKRQVHGA